MNLILCQDCYESPSCIAVDESDGLHLYEGVAGEYGEEDQELVIENRYLNRFRRAILLAAEEREFEHTLGHIKITTLPCRPKACAPDYWRINIWDREKRRSVAFDNDEAWALAAIAGVMAQVYESRRRRCTC